MWKAISRDFSIGGPLNLAKGKYVRVWVVLNVTVDCETQYILSDGDSWHYFWEWL